MLVGRCGGWSQSPRRGERCRRKRPQRVPAALSRPLAALSSSGATNLATCASWSGLLRLSALKKTWSWRIPVSSLRSQPNRACDLAITTAILPSALLSTPHTLRAYLFFRPGSLRFIFTRARYYPLARVSLTFCHSPHLRSCSFFALFLSSLLRKSTIRHKLSI